MAGLLGENLVEHGQQAVVFAGAQVVMTTSTVENNEANVELDAEGTSYGGGLYVAGGNYTLSMTFSNDTVESNSASFGGGLYVAGGIAVKVLPLLKGGRFIAAMNHKEKMEGFLKQVPVRVVLDEECPLKGAAHVASQGL